MIINNLIRQNNLMEADAIILRKKVLGMVDHFAIFVGYRNNYPIFVANYKDGVKEVSINEMQEVLKTLRPTSIERFKGDEYQRKLALKRAMLRIGEKSYSYITNNCEHFKNWVHTGEHKSEQVRKAGNIAVGVAATTAIYSVVNKSPRAGATAVGLLLLGALLMDVSEK